MIVSMSTETKRLQMTDSPPAYAITAKLTLDDGAIVSVPAVWCESDITRLGTPAQISELFLALMTNWIDVLGDTSDMHYKRGAYATDLLAATEHSERAADQPTSPP